MLEQPEQPQNGAGEQPGPESFFQPPPSAQEAVKTYLKGLREKEKDLVDKNPDVVNGVTDRLSAEIDAFGAPLIRDDNGEIIGVDVEEPPKTRGLGSNKVHKPKASRRKRGDYTRARISDVGKRQEA